jgi:hypothetical protein
MTEREWLEGMRLNPLLWHLASNPSSRNKRLLLVPAAGTSGTCSPTLAAGLWNSPNRRPTEEPMKKTSR